MPTNKGFLLGAVAGVGLAGAAAAGVGMTLPHAMAQSAEPGLVRTAAPIFAAGPGAPMTFADIFERVAPAVVSIEVTARVPRSELGGGQGAVPFPFNQLPQFRNQPPTGRGAPGQRAPNGRRGGTDGDGDGDGDDSDLPEAQAAGSGFLVSADGYIVTNNHVIENATKITVKLNDKRELPATLVGRDEESDLAVIKVDATGSRFPFVTFETQAKPRVGDWVLAVGNPLQLGGTATAGIVSAIGRDIPGDSAGNLPSEYLQIDAPINRGNSGGPTFDTYGRVIGVNTAIYSSTGGSIGIGFAVPSDTADQIVKELIAGRRITRGYLGASIQNIGTESAESLGISQNAGALIAELTPGGPGARAGLQPGDIVLSINGQKISGSSELTRAVARTRSGETMRLEIRRNGRVQTVNVVAGVRPSVAQLNKGNGAEGSLDNSGPGNLNRPNANRETVLGLAVQPLTEALKKENSIPADVRGVFIDDVTEGSDAAKRRLVHGMVILQANERPVSTPQEFAAAVADARKAGRPSVFLLIRQASGQNAGLALKLDETRPTPRSAPTPR